MIAMGLFKKKKQPSTEDTLRIEGRINRQKYKLDHAIRSLDNRLETEKQKALSAQKEGNDPKIRAALRTIDAIETRLSHLRAIRNVLADMGDAHQVQTLHRNLIDSLTALNDTLPKGKRKRKPSNEEATLKDTMAYLETMMDTADTPVDTRSKNPSKDDLDAFFNSKSS